jgi:hypothetical protein
LLTQDDEFPYQSDDPALQPPQLQPAALVSGEQGDEDLKFLLRLLIGSAVEGSDEFRRRARLWQAEMSVSDPSRMVISDDDETGAANLRYSLIGFLFHSVDAGYKSISFLERASSRAYSLVSRAFAPLTKSRFWRPVQDRFDLYGSVGETIVSSWNRTGRREEQVSRALARKQAYNEIVNDIIAYLAQKPEVRDLVQQQSVGMVEEIVGDIRERSSEFDSQLEDRVYRLMGRRRIDDQTPPNV